MKEFARKAWRVSTRHILPVFLLLALSLRLTIKDTWPVFAPLFYGTPLPLLACGFLAYGILAKPGWRVRLLALGTSCVLGGWWLAMSPWTSLSPNDETIGDDALSVMFWNFSRDGHPDEALSDLLAKRQPDVLAMVESGIDSHLLPGYDGYEVKSLPSGMAVSYEAWSS